MEPEKKQQIGYSGIEGSFAYIAARHLYPQGEYRSYGSFRECYESVEKGQCEIAVLPVENSFAGEVGEVTDLIYNGSLYVIGEYVFPIRQCLLGTQDSDESTIRTVLSHPQALAQSAGYITAHGLKTISCENTARAARTVAETNDRQIGAVASSDTAELYGLKVIRANIQDSTTNATKFLTLSRVPEVQRQSDDTDISILMFAVKNVSGSLLKALTVISKYGYNMRVIRSRPLKNVSWEYYFYTEIEGDLHSDNGTRMLDELQRSCSMMKVAGTFKAEENEQ